MRKIIGFLLASVVALSAALSGCSPSGPLYGPQANTSAASVRVAASQQQIAPDDSTTATISATVLDGNNNGLPNVTVVFASSAGGLTVNAAGKTDASGVATATIRAAGAAPGTVIAVTATVGSASASAQVTVLATTQTMTLTTTKTQIKSDGSDTATITAFVRGASNQFLPNVPVNFTSTSGGLSVATAMTDQNGAAATVLTGLPDPSNRTITVTVTTGPNTQTITVDVTGTTLNLNGPVTLIQGSQGNYVVTLTNAGQQPLPGRSVTLASASAAATVVAPATRLTDSQGSVSFSVTGAVAGPGTLTATALGMTVNQSINVSSDTLILTAPAANANISLSPTTANISATWTVGGAPAAAGQTISFSTTRGTIPAGGTLSAGTALTNASGVATITIGSTGAGPAVITASTATGLSAQVPVTFIATTPATIVVQASPTNVPVNTASTISALVRDASGNFVQGQTVDFGLTDFTGGSLSVGSAVTDVQGRAQTTYNASSASSSSNGVIVSAIVRGTAVTGQALLTVGGRTIFMSLGTGNTIFEPNSTQYYVEYVVQALDTAGNPLVNQPITFTIHSLDYFKGFRALNGPLWFTQYTLINPPTNSCPNEDVNTNGILDAVTVCGPGLISEDKNGNCKLDPGDVASVFPATINTDATGSAVVRVTYPQDFSYYLRARLTATTTVQGTETSKFADFMLQGISSDFNQPTITPPGPVSPYGQSTTCSDTL